VVAEEDWVRVEEAGSGWVEGPGPGLGEESGWGLAAVAG